MYYAGTNIYIMEDLPSEPAGVTILYGSETGNAEDFARCLWRKLQYRQHKPTLSTLDDYPMKNLITHTKVLIIICSTTGQGDFPRNAKKFMRFLLKKKLPGDLLNHIKLTTFGLGDSSYSKYNHAIKKIHTRLLQLGCSELSPRCEADEMSPEGVDGFYKEWESQLLESIDKVYPEKAGIDENWLLPAVNPLVVKEETTVEWPSDLSLTRVQDTPSLHVGTIKENKRITADDHFQDVRHITIESQGLNYAPGDTVSLFPINDHASVELLIQSQPHWIPVADMPLRIEGDRAPIEGGLIDESKITLRSLLIHHLDIVAVPRRSFFQLLWHFVDPSTEDGKREQEKLQEFGSWDDPEELYNYANRPNRSILETLLEFQQNLEIPLRYVYDLFPKIKPRLFSIASRPSPSQVELVVALVQYKTMIRRVRKGLCSKWLKQLIPGDRIVFSTQKVHMKFSTPQNNIPPVIMIAPGTGVAPMKSVIEHVAHLESGQKMYLFFGCRYRAKDYLFESLWESLIGQNKLEVFTAFSRDSDSTSKYVQDRIYKEHQLVSELILNRGAIVVVCGSSGSMPKQVRITLAKVLAMHSLSQEEAEKYVLDMEDHGRYKEDTW